MDYRSMDRVDQVEKVHVYTLVSGCVVSKLLPKAVLSNDHPAPPLRCAYVIDKDKTRCLLKNYDAGTFENEKEPRKEKIDGHTVKKSRRKCKSKRMALRRLFEAKANADEAGSNFLDVRRELRKRDHEISKKEKDPQNYPVANDLDPDFVRGIKCSRCERFLVSSTMICQQNHPICLVCAELSHYTCSCSSCNIPKDDDISHYECILCHSPLAITDQFTKIMKLCKFRCTEEACEQKDIIFNYEDFVQHTMECKLKFLAPLSPKK